MAKAWGREGGKRSSSKSHRLLHLGQKPLAHTVVVQCVVDGGHRVGVQLKLVMLRSYRAFSPFLFYARVITDAEKVLGGWCDYCHINKGGINTGTTAHGSQSNGNLCSPGISRFPP